MPYNNIVRYYLLKGQSKLSSQIRHITSQFEINII